MRGGLAAQDDTVAGCPKRDHDRLAGEPIITRIGLARRRCRQHGHWIARGQICSVPSSAISTRPWRRPDGVSGLMASNAWWNTPSEASGAVPSRRWRTVVPAGMRAMPSRVWQLQRPSLEPSLMGRERGTTHDKQGRRQTVRWRPCGQNVPPMGHCEGQGAWRKPPLRGGADEIGEAAHRGRGSYNSAPAHEGDWPGEPRVGGAVGRGMWGMGFAWRVGTSRAQKCWRAQARAAIGVKVWRGPGRTGRKGSRPVAKVGVEGSNPFARSRFPQENQGLRSGPPGPFLLPRP